MATSMCLFWNIYLRHYFEGNPYVAAVVDEGESEADEADSSDEGPPKSVTTPVTGAEGSFPPLAGNDAGKPAVASNPASSSVGAEGASDEAEDGGHSALDAEIPGKLHAGQMRSAVNISSKEVLKLGRRGSASSRADDSSTDYPLKTQKLDDKDDSMGKPPAGGALTSLVGRPMLFAKTTGAPNPRAAPPAEPPTPARGSGVASPSVKFALRRALEAGSVATIAELINRWVSMPCTEPEEAVMVEVVSAHEFSAASTKQDDVSLLLPREVLAQTSLKRHAIDTGAQNVDMRPAMDGAVVDVVVKGVSLRLPLLSMVHMAERHGINEAYKVAGQSSLCLQMLSAADGGDHLVDPQSNPFLLPVRQMVTKMKETIKAAVGNSTLKDKIWQRAVAQSLDPSTGEPVNLVTSWTLTAECFVEAARPVWLTCSFVDPFLFELARWCSVNGSGIHVMTCEKFTASLRTPQGATVALADAARLRWRWAVAAKCSSRVATMVNQGNAHWCAAIFHLSTCEILFYDSLALVNIDVETEFTLARLRHLGGCIDGAQLRGILASSSAGWATSRVGLQRQTDSVSYGLFALQFLVQHVTRTKFEINGDEADLLRVFIMLSMVVAGRAQRDESASAK